MRLTAGSGWLDQDWQVTVPRPVMGAGALPWKGGGPVRSVTWLGLGLSGLLLLGMAARSAGVEKRARPEAVLEIMSLDEGDATLRLSWPWGGMAEARDDGFPSRATTRWTWHPR